jgi:hypothetical protein
METLVRPGDKVRAGETPIIRFTNDTKGES